MISDVLKVVLMNLSHVVEISVDRQREIEVRKRKRRYERLTAFMIHLITFCIFYVLSGYFSKWMWYGEDIDYNIFDFKQFIGFVLGASTFSVFWWFVLKYCPVCTGYSSYYSRKNEQIRFMYYQFAGLIIVLCYWGVIELYIFIYN